MADSPTPDTDRLLDWLEGKLEPEETAVFAQQIAATPALQEQVAWLQEFWQLSRTTTLAAPPPTVRQAATAAFAAYAKAKRPSTFLQTLIASLTADNWQRPTLAGARNVSLRSEPRQLIYSSDLADIALNAQMGSSGRVDLSGQLFPLDDSDPAEFLIQLLQDGLEQRHAFANDLGKFSLPNLPPGTYSLLLSRPGLEIEIGPLELG